MDPKIAKILIIVFVVLIAGLAAYFVFYQPKEQTGLTSSEIETATAGWINFNSASDLGINQNFSFKYPPNWMHKGSTDGGFASYAAFYEKDKYSQDCSEVSGVFVCDETGQVAGVLVSISSPVFAKVEYDEEIREAVTIDGYQGTKISGRVKFNIDPALLHVGKLGQKETRVLIPDADGMSFEFVMLTDNDSAELIFNTILETTDLNF